MFTNVICSESKCLYHCEGMCTLEKVTPPSKNNPQNTDCLYFCTKPSNQDNQAQMP